MTQYSLKNLLATALVMALISGTALGQQLSSFVNFSQSFPHNYKSLVKFDDNGSFYHYDKLYESVDADPGSGVSMINPNAVSGMLLAKHQASGDLIWSVFIPNGDYYYFDIDMTSDGGSVITGSFDGSVDVDPGPSEYLLTSTGYSSVFVIKYSPDGSLEWAVSSSGGYNLMASSLEIDINDNIILGGYFSGTMDFDLGPNEFSLTASSDINSYTLKLNEQGQFMWAFALGSTNMTYTKWIESDSQGNVVLRGVFSTQLDMDPSASLYYIENTTQNTQAEFVAKYDAEGHFVWAHSHAFNASSSADIDLLMVDSNDDIIIVAMSSEYNDLDPGIGVATASMGDESFGTYVVIVKYSTTGAYLWHRVFTNAGMTTCALDADDNIYVCGMAQVGTDVDAGPGIFEPNFDNHNSLFISKHNSAGDFVNAFSLYSDVDWPGNWATDMQIINQNDIVLVGLYQSNLDIEPGIGEEILPFSVNNWPLFVATYAQGECAELTFTIAEATDLTCEDYLGTASAAFITGTPPYSYLWSGGEVTSTINPVSPGIYSVTGTDALGCQASRQVLINGPSTQNGFDLVPNLSAWNFVPGFSTSIQIDAFNQGCQLQSGSLVLTLDTDLIFEIADPPASSISGNVLTWDFSDLSYDSEHITPTVIVSIPANTILGDVMSMTLAMNPTIGDYNESDNIKTYDFVVIGAYDPNLIEVSPQGAGSDGYIENNQTMTYTIHFQNTGTAPAVNVNIANVLDENLDLSTIQVIASSHDMQTEVIAGNMLQFRFENIMLPDSTNNEPESHGYLIYTVQQQDNLTPMTTIENTASIFFDFNPPIHTNTVLNTIQDIIGLEETDSKSRLQVYPNPTSGFVIIDCGNSFENEIQLFDAEGRLVKNFRTLSNKFTLDSSELKTGLYQVSVRDAQGKMTSTRLIVR